MMSKCGVTLSLHPQRTSWKIGSFKLFLKPIPTNPYPSSLLTIFCFQEILCEKQDQDAVTDFQQQNLIVLLVFVAVVGILARS